MNFNVKKVFLKYINIYLFLTENSECKDHIKCDEVWYIPNLKRQKCAVKIVQEICRKRCGLCNGKYYHTNIYAYMLKLST